MCVPQTAGIVFQSKCFYWRHLHHSPPVSSSEGHVWSREISSFRDRWRNRILICVWSSVLGLWEHSTSKAVEFWFVSLYVLCLSQMKTIMRVSVSTKYQFPSRTISPLCHFQEAIGMVHLKGFMYKWIMQDLGKIFQVGTTQHLPVSCPLCV